MRSPVSSSEPNGPGPAFDRYHERVRRWVWQQGWTALRDIQERAADPILAGDRDVLIASATASGKTEAALLPALTRILDNPRPGLRLLCISPLKALINDQHRRLETLCEALELPVHRWHGDAPASGKRAVIGGGGGVVLITPESLEALFVVHGPALPKLFAALAFVVVDELHAFIGSERGKQLQSLLHRVELTARRGIPRVGLSATLGDMDLAADFLRPAGGERVTRVVSGANRHDVRLQVRGYVTTGPAMTARQAAAAAQRGHAVALDQLAGGDDVAIAADLWRTLRSGRHIVFCNRRSDVELYGDLLRDRADREGVPPGFWPHHGSLSKELREDAEAALKDTTRPATVIATSTLELGIDVGSVETIAQVGPPSSVAATRQRLGRSGRAADAASVLRVFVPEDRITAQTPPPDTLRADLVQAVAVVRLLVARWFEPPDPDAPHLSVLVQQTLSLVAQHGGVTAADAWRVLCQATGPFPWVDRATYVRLLRSIGAHGLVTQTDEGQLVLGPTGERLVNHHDFYAAFSTPREYRLITAGRTLGTLPVETPLAQDMHLIFAGRRWVVLEVDTDAKVVDVVPSPGGRPPSFGGRKPPVHDHVRHTMLAVYLDDDVPAYLDATGRRLVEEGREWFGRLGLTDGSLLAWGDATLLFPWAGDRVLDTLALQLTAAGIEAAAVGIALNVEAGIDRVRRHLTRLADAGPADPAALAAAVENLDREKHHRWLDRALLESDFAASGLDPAGAHRAIRRAVAWGGSGTDRRVCSCRSGDG